MTQRRVESDVLELVAELYLRDVRGPAETHRRLVAAEQEGLIPKGSVPSARTVRRIVDEMAGADSSEPWTLALANPQTGWLMDVLAARLERTLALTPPALTQLEVTWLERIHAARPDVPPWLGWGLAHLYIQRTARHEVVADLDSVLALAPWRGIEHHARYLTLVARGRVPWAEEYLREQWAPQGAGEADRVIEVMERLEMQLAGGRERSPFWQPSSARGANPPPLKDNDDERARAVREWLRGAVGAEESLLDGGRGDAHV
ncbi:MAG: hypothetical protein R2706_19655 [Acidimicrobiales bacterium]